MKKINIIRIYFIMLLTVQYLYSAGQAISQEQTLPVSADTIIIGDRWNPETRKLDVIFEDQTRLNLGIEGIRKIQLWTEILNGANKEVLWIIEYANGIRQEIWVQNVRYNRYRTYLEKTFRRKLWDTESEKTVDVSGQCRIFIVDNNQKDKVIAEKIIILE